MIYISYTSICFSSSVLSHCIFIYIHDFPFFLILHSLLSTLQFCFVCLFLFVIKYKQGFRIHILNADPKKVFDPDTRYNLFLLSQKTELSYQTISWQLSELFVTHVLYENFTPQLQSMFPIQPFHKSREKLLSYSFPTNLGPKTGNPLPAQRVFPELKLPITLKRFVAAVV